MLTTATLDTIRENGKRFYADDYKLTSAEINRMKKMGLIEKSGNTKEITISVKDNDNFKITVSEWVLK